MIDVATVLEGNEIVDFIPEIFDEMMNTHLRTVVKAYCPNGVDTARGWGRRCRVVETGRTVLAPVTGRPTISVAKVISDDTGIKIRVRVQKRTHSFMNHSTPHVAPTITVYYSLSMTTMDTNLIKSKHFDTGLRRYQPKGIGYNFFIGDEILYDGSVPFKDFLIKNVADFKSKDKRKEIDEKLDTVKAEYASMRSALNRF